MGDVVHGRRGKWWIEDNGDGETILFQDQRIAMVWGGRKAENAARFLVDKMNELPTISANQPGTDPGRPLPAHTPGP